MFSLAEENYVKAIYHLERECKGQVSTNAIADRMETKPSSVTDMVQKLAEKDVLSYEKYRGAQLTETGRKIAVNVIRKHRLWEVFLVEKLNFPWDEVHDIAEQLEHIQSDELITRLDKFLEYPDFDPHGDPIPDKHGNVKRTEKRLLSVLNHGDQGICVGVKESDSDFLKYMDTKKIGIGTPITVLNVEEFDGSMTIQAEEAPFFISKKIADNIYVQTS